MDKRLTVTFMSGGIHLTNFDNRVKQVLLEFSRKRIQWTTAFKRGRPVRKADKVFAASNNYRTEFLFSSGDWDELKLDLNDAGIKVEQIEIKNKGYKSPARLKVTSVSTFEDRDYQSEIISWAVEPSCTLLTLPLQTGRGKTATALRCLEEIEWRGGIISSMRHLKQWRGDIKKQFDVKDDDIYMVQGKDRLIKLIKEAKKAPLPYKFILLSNATIQSYIKRCEMGDWKAYGCKPQDLLQLCRIGVKVIDEVHEWLHFNFKLSIYFHVKKSIYLSATIEGDDSFTNKMASTMMPSTSRYDKLEWKKYIDVYALAYCHGRKDMKINHPGNPNYAHAALEQWYLSNNTLKERYFNMIGDLMLTNFVNAYKDGLKAVVFVAYVDMATELTKYLEERFRQFTVGRYCGTMSDPAEVLYDYDIRVSTPESMGTGTDVDNLYFNLCTVNISAIRRNIQVQGRTRENKLYPGLNPVFMYLYATDIQKHVDAHKKRIEIFTPKSKSIRTILSDYVI